MAKSLSLAAIAIVFVAAITGCGAKKDSTDSSAPSSVASGSSTPTSAPTSKPVPVTEASVEGKWLFKSVDLDIGQDPKNAPIAEARLKGEFIDLTPDKKFSMKSIQGTWKLDGRTVTLKSTKINGMTPDEAKAKQISMLMKNPTTAAKLKDPAIMKRLRAMDPAPPIPATISDDGLKLTLKGNGGYVNFVKA